MIKVRISSYPEFSTMPEDRPLDRRTRRIGSYAQPLGGHVTESGTCRRYRPDPVQVGVVESWGHADAQADVAANVLVVTVRGDIDATNGARLADYVERHGAVAPSLVIDTRGVDFFGTAGVAALRRIDYRLGRGGVRWSLVAGAAVRKVLRVCRADDLPQTPGAFRPLVHPEPSATDRHIVSV
jgi:anti-anti-sigma factor